MELPKMDLPPVVDYPSPSSSSILSSALSDPDAYHDLQEQTRKRLAKYVLESNDDDTVRLLQVALGFLPKMGKINLMHDIVDLKHDIKLRQLRLHFVSAILVACKC
jgi:hypothetical protein